jgi:predicted nucleic acid-binding protein
VKYLLDTNVFREIGKSEPHKNVRAWLASVDDADLAISALIVREVAKGIAKLAPSKPAVAAEIAARTEAVFDAFAGRILPIASGWDAR